MYLGKADVNTYDKGAGREFLVSSRGSYGFSTVIGANTRREHGLLVVRPEGALKHSVLVSKIEETVFDNNKKYQLSTNRYKDLVYPDGYRYLQEYQGNPFPSMLFVIHSILLKKSIFMPQDKPCTVLKYELLASPDKIRLDLRPLFAHRLNNAVSSESEKQFTHNIQNGTSVEVEGRGYKSYCSATSGSWSIKPLWFENIIYEQDDRPDSPSVDQLWSPGYVTNEISQGDVLYIVLSNEPVSFTMEELKAMEKEAADRFENVLEQANFLALSSAEQDMIFASYHLTDDRKSPMSPIYTGYPSVENNSRSAFIALPGITLATGREEVAAKTLDFWGTKASESGWVMPEMIEYDGHPVFTGADNGLWFVYAAEKYIEHVGESRDTSSVRGTLLSIVDRYLNGVEELDITCEENGLLYLTKESPARHWMYAEINGETVVSRKGYLVEVNALWYNALRAAVKYACAEKSDRYKAAADLCEKSFRETFWSTEINGLYDFVDPKDNKKCATIRPGQILAVSMPYSPLTKEMSIKVVELCWNELYTTYGLRTLDPRHDKFKGRCEGRTDQRIKARMRGMAWPWLLGQFITAYLKLNPTRKDIGWAFIRPFNSHLRHGCLGGIAEVFDGMMPYRPHGDVVSAASLGELLRVLYEDLEDCE